MAIVAIDGVLPGSIADRHGIRAGDKIVSINGRPVRDMLEYRFLTADEGVSLSLVSPSGAREVQVQKAYGEDIGLVFRDPLFDGVRRCHNNCIFCFVDQLPCGMRESLYLKDDDYRLSFLQGNFVTLTNVSGEDLARIKEMRLSPLYVSVHATSPEPRIRMMRNPRAGDIMSILRELAGAGIEIHTQVVLCKGVNDGDQLRDTIMSLSALWPHVRSCGIVPVGVTKFQRYTERFSAIPPSEAEHIIDEVGALARSFLKKLGSRFVFLADEFFLMAGRPLPGRRYYEGFFQKENGIGIARSFIDSFRRAARRLICGSVASSFRRRRISVVTGVLGGQVLRREVDQLPEVPGRDIRIYPVPNRFFGESVTVAGLVTGKDIIHYIRERDPGDEILVPRVMLRAGDETFLDDVTVDDIRREFGVPVRIVDAEGGAFARAVLGKPCQTQDL